MNSCMCRVVPGLLMGQAEAVAPSRQGCVLPQTIACFYFFPPLPSFLTSLMGVPCSQPTHLLTAFYLRFCQGT